MTNKIFRKKGYCYWFTSPWIISIILTSIYIFTYPEFFNIYKADYRAMLCRNGVWKSYEDMDCDGRDDVVSIVRKELKLLTKITCLKKEALLNKNPILDVAPFAEDYNNDKSKEIYFLSQSRDSIYLSIWDYKTNKITNVFLQTVSRSFKYDYLGCADANNDGSKEFYFWAYSTRDFDKRSVLRYDIKNNALIRTKGLDIRFSGGYLAIIEGEPKIVVSTLSYNTRNKEKVNYGDKFAGVFVLDKDLNFAFDPIKYNKTNYCLACLNIKDQGKDRICVIADGNSRTGEERHYSFVNIYDYFGNKIREKIIYHDLFLKEGGCFSFDNNNNSKILLTSRSGGLLKYNSQLTFEGKLFPGGMERPIADFIADIDQNGEYEIFFHDQGFKGLVITRGDLSHPVLINLLEPYSDIKFCKPIVNCSVNIRSVSLKNRYSGLVKENIIVHNKGFMYFINYCVDKFFWLKYIYALAVFLASFLLVWWIRYSVSKSIEDKYAVENTIAQLKFQNVSNQMSPHFTLNAMNSIASLIYKEDRETAYDYLCKLAKLVRNSLIDANRLERSLKEELDFVSSYLELQKFRFKNRFDYFINVDSPVVYNFNVMPFLVQTFVENAMKHGLKDVGSGGKVIIDIKLANKGINIIIEDNGQGRKAAAKNKGISTGKGIQLVNEYIDILNKKDDRNMSISIVDLEENNVAKGTRVEIFIDKA